MLQEDTYPIILLVLALATCLLPILVLILLGYKGIRLYRLVASYVFSNIITKSTDNRGTTTWLFKDIILTNEETILPQIIKSLFGLFLGVLTGVLLVFYQFLLLDISYSCDENDRTKYCYKLWPKTLLMNNHAIDCNSTAIQNETVDVVCYKFVFSPELALSVSYFTFQFSMFILNAATSGLLLVKESRIIGKIQCKMGVLFVAVTALGLTINLTSLRVFFVSANPVFLIQLIITVIIGIGFVNYIPWRFLIALKNEDSTVYTPDNVVLPLSFQSLLSNEY